MYQYSSGYRTGQSRNGRHTSLERSNFSCSSKELWDAMMTNHNKAAVCGWPIKAAQSKLVSRIYWQNSAPLESHQFR